jgi:hypothetical protein
LALSFLWRVDEILGALLCVKVREIIKENYIENVYDGRPDGSVLIRLQDRTEIVIFNGIIRQETEVVIKPGG